MKQDGRHRTTQEVVQEILPAEGAARHHATATRRLGGVSCQDEVI